MARIPIKPEIREDWVQSQKDAADGIFSVGGLAHRAGLLKAQTSAEAGRLTLAKFVELARREKNQSPRELAMAAGVEVADVVALENPQWPIDRAEVIESVARALGVDSSPLLELAGFNQSNSGELDAAAIEFASRLGAVKPLEPQEKEALTWLRDGALRAKPAKAG